MCSAKRSAIGRASAVLLFCAAASLAVPAVAGGLHRDSVHADSFGNLVIYSPTGYKRIIVGMGEAADGYNVTGSYYEPEVVYLEDDAPSRASHHCSRQAVIVHGRSYMHGLPANVVLVPAGICH